jgi:alpha-glucosidase
MATDNHTRGRGRPDTATYYDPAAMPRHVRSLAGALLAVTMVACSTTTKRGEPAASLPNPWWQPGVIYQIYPRSFQDSNGDGIGDLKGITRRLDYLKDLGVDALWISPIYPSPMADFGYDVSDYTHIDPRFGTLPEFDELLAAAHARGLRVLLDFVPNHSSNQHPWFVESRRSRDNPKRDWYVWRDPGPRGGPPNNWVAVFGGPAWERDTATGQYYYHAFLKEQPDLNWRNAAVQQAMFDVIRFWLGRGVDGFRVDTIWLLLEDDQLRDNPVNPNFRPGMLPAFALTWTHTADQPDTHALVRRMRAVFDEYPDRVLVAELLGSLSRLVSYYGATCDETQLPFNFQLIDATWEAPKLAELIANYEAALPSCAWPDWVLGNHDQHRVVTRLGPAQARVAAMLLLTLRGTPTLYYGDELGLPDAVVPPNLAQDPLERQQPGHGLGRDPERSPMTWDASANAGFTSGHPWLPLVAEWRTFNVDAELNDPDSLLSFYRRLLALRRTAPALAVGSYAGLPSPGSVLGYMRRLRGQPGYLVALNLGDAPAEFAPDGVDFSGKITLGTNRAREGERVTRTIQLAGHEGVIIRLAR